MRKKIFSILLSVAMVMVMMPSMAFAGSQSEVDCTANGTCAHEASITVDNVTTHYDTLEEAINAAPTGNIETTIKVLKNVVLENQLEIENRTITLQLNKNTISYGGTSQITSGLILVHNGASLTIDDNYLNKGTIDGGNDRMADGSAKVYAAVALTKKGDDATESAKLTLKYGTLKGCYYGIVGNGLRHNTDIHLERGVVSCYDDEGAGIYHPQNGNLTIDYTTVTGASGVYFKSGHLSITNAKINGIGSKVDFVHSDNGFQSTGDALLIEACGYPGGVPTVVELSGGTFKSANNKAVAYYEAGDYHMENTKFITGGSFSSNPTEYVADGFLAQKTSDTEYKVNAEDSFVAEVVGGLKYTTLSSALSAAPKDGTLTQIKLLKSVELPVGLLGKLSITSNRNILLDLNGQDISSKGNPYIFKVQGAKLQITGSGKISINYKSDSSSTYPIWAVGSATDVADYTVITVDKGVTLESNDTGILIYADSSGKTYNNYGLVINMNGTIDATSVGITVNGYNTVTTGNVMQINLDGAKIENSIIPIYAAGYAKWNLKNCTLKGINTAVEIRSGEMDINGGTYTSTADSFTCDPNGGGTTTVGAAIAIAQHTTKKDITVNINDGTFNGVKALNESNPQNNDPAPQVNLAVSGGTFNGDVAVADAQKFITGGTFSSNPKEYKAGGYNVYKYNDSKYVVANTDPTGYVWTEKDGIYEGTRIPTTPTTPVEKDPVSNEGTAGTDDATTNADLTDKVTTSDGKTEAVVDQDVADKIVDKAVENKSTEVIVEATTPAGKSDASQVALPESTVKAIAEKTDAAITIKTDNAEVTLDKEAVNAVADHAGTTGTVKLVVETVENTDEKVVVELKLETSNGYVSDFKGGNVTVTVPVAKDMADKKVVCVYIDDNGIYTKVEGQLNADGTYTFKTGHFSTYAIMSEEEADAVIKDQTAAAEKAAIKKVKATVTLSTRNVKKGIKVTVKVPVDQKADKTGIILYRSMKKGSGYAMYKKIETKSSTYIITNTKNVKGNRLTVGKRYYYKARAYKVIDGKTYYGPMSTVKYMKAK